MTSKAVQMFKIKVPLEAVKRLSSEDRYSYYILGHVFNELMTLQKLFGFSMQKHDDTREVRVVPEWAQTLMLFRMSASKMHEAVLVLHSKQVSDMLSRYVLPKMERGPARLKELNVAVNAASWLATLRNNLGFHYPKYSQWQAYTEPTDDWVDDSLYLSERVGNTFFEGADTIAQHWMFQQYGGGDVREQIAPMVEQLIDLFGIMTKFLEEAVSLFTAEVLLERRDVRKPMGKVLAPVHDKVSIPFWTWSPDDSDA